MLNYLWGYMILIGLAVGIVTGQVEAVSNAAIDSAGEAVTLSITMLGIMGMWTGLIEVAKAAGLMDRMTRGMKPVLHFLFPRLSSEELANEYITANIIANVLGLGWAATPMGLKAMKELAVIHRSRIARRQQSMPEDSAEWKRLERQKTKASDEMCTFLVLNISSLQVIPVSIIAYRSQYGSVNPAAIVVPALLATTISTAAAVLYCRIKCRKKEYE